MLKNNSGGLDCWERRLLINQEQLEAGMATNLLQPRLQVCRWPSAAAITGCLCIFGGKVSRADLPVGVDVVFFIALMNFSWRARLAFEH